MGEGHGKLFLDMEEHGSRLDGTRNQQLKKMLG